MNWGLAMAYIHEQFAAQRRAEQQVEIASEEAAALAEFANDLAQRWLRGFRRPPV